MNFEVDEISPGAEPSIKQSGIRAFHDLVATREIRRDPAGHVPKSFRCEPPVKPEALVNRPRVAAAKVLDDHEKHREPAALKSKNDRGGRESPSLNSNPRDTKLIRTSALSFSVL
jgi:hypothetical protein